MSDATIETVAAYESGYAAAKAELKPELVRLRNLVTLAREAIRCYYQAPPDPQNPDSYFVPRANAMMALALAFAQSADGLAVCPACGVAQYGNDDCPECQQHHLMRVDEAKEAAQTTMEVYDGDVDDDE